MKINTKAKISAKLMIKLAAAALMLVLGLSGVGYIPGKPAYFGVLSGALLILGTALMISFYESMKALKKRRERAERVKRQRPERAAVLHLVEKSAS